MKDSRGPLCEATQDSVRKEIKPGIGGLQEEVTLSLVDKKENIAEGDLSNLARKGTETSELSSERAAGHNGLLGELYSDKTGSKDAAEGVFSNLADKPVRDVSTVPSKDRFCGGKATKSLQERDQKCNTQVLQEEVTKIVQKSVNISEDIGAVGQSCNETIEDPERIEDDSVETEQKSVVLRSERKRKQVENTSSSETRNETDKKLKSNIAEGGTPKAGDSVSGVVNCGKNDAVVQESEIDRSMILAVVPVGFPDEKLSEEQAEEVERALVEKFYRFYHGEPIQFSAVQYENGGLTLTCDTMATKSWLIKTVPKLVPWLGAKLTAGTAHFTMKGTKFVFWLIGTMKKRDNKIILDLIQKQNKNISTAEWKILMRVMDGYRERLTIWVDDQSFESLRSRSYRLFLGLGQSKLTLWSEWKMLPATYSLSKTLPKIQHPPQPREQKITDYKQHTPQNLHSNLPWSHRSRFSGPNLPRPRQVRILRQIPSQHSKHPFSDSEPPPFHKVQFQNQSLPPEPRYMGATIQQKHETRFTVSEQSHQHRESSYFVSNQLQEVRDHLQPQEAVYVVSGQPQSRQHRYKTSDLPLSCDSGYVGHPPPHNSRNVPSNQVHSQDYRFRDSHHMRSQEGIFVEREPPVSYGSRFRMTEPPRFGEGRFSASNSHQLQQPGSSFVRLTHTHFSRPLDSNRANFARYSQR